MNKLWTFIILLSFIFSIVSGSYNNLMNNFFKVPSESLSMIVSLGCFIVIFNGFYQVAVDSRLIKKINYLFRPLIKFIYKIDDDKLIELLSSNFTANFLGLGIASTPIAIKAIEEIKDYRVFNKLVCLNISCFSIFPLNILSLREIRGATNNILIWILLIIISLSTTIFSIIICKIGDRK